VLVLGIYWECIPVKSDHNYITGLDKFSKLLPAVAVDDDDTYEDLD
jgi:hypothetical protein